MYHNKSNGAVHQQLKCLEHDLVARSEQLNYEGGPSAADCYLSRIKYNISLAGRLTLGGHRYGYYFEHMRTRELISGR